MIKFEKITNISKERALQYEIYEPFNKTKLNLSLCDNTTISIYSPVILSNELQQIYNEIKGMDMIYSILTVLFIKIYVFHLNHLLVQMFYLLIEYPFIIIIMKQYVNQIVNFPIIL